MSQSAARRITLQHDLYPQQQRFLDSEAKYRCFVAGIGSGKTRVGVMDVIRQPPKTRGMIVAPTYQMLRDATLDSFFEIGGGELVDSFNQSTGEMLLKNGTEVLWRSAENFEALRGPNLGWVYIDEAALIKEMAYDILIGRLREAPGRLWVTTTPKGYDWIHRLWVKENAENPDYYLVRASTRDNTFLPPGYVDSLEAKYAGGFALQEIDGEFCEWGKNPAYEFLRGRNAVRGLRLEYRPDLPLCLMCDFNYLIKPWGVGQIINGHPRIIGEVVVRGGTTKDAVEEFRNQFPAHGGELQIYGDASGKNKSGQTARTDYQLIVEALRGYQAPVRLMIPGANPRVRDRVNNTNRILRGEDGVGPLKLDEEYCQFLIDDFLNSQWDKSGRDLKKVTDPEDPAAEWTHGTDAAGYWLWRLFPFVTPVAAQVAKKQRKGAARPLVYGRIAGDA